MKTKIMVLATMVSAVFFVNSTSYSQVIETVGAGVIDFLLKNPKTASQTNATETAALSVIRNLLSISGHRKHQMNVANALRSEIVINTTGGNQATMYSDNEGNIYLLFNEKIYPISTGLVNMARGETVGAKMKNSTLPNYNLSKLRNEYKFEKSDYKWVEYFMEKDEETLDEIAQKHNVSIDDIYFQIIRYKKGKVIYEYNGNKYPIYSLTTGKLGRDYVVGTMGGSAALHICICTKLKLARKNKGRYKGYAFCPKSKCPMGYAIFIKIPIYQHQIVTTLTCNWFKDFDGQGLDLNDFNGIKRSFHKGEQQLFVLGYTTEIEGTWVLEIYESLTGKIVYKKTGTMEKGAQIITTEKEGEKLPSGVYVYNFALVSEDEKYISKSEKFEIILVDEK